MSQSERLQLAGLAETILASERLIERSPLPMVVVMIDKTGGEQLIIRRNFGGEEASARAALGFLNILDSEPGKGGA